MQQLRLSSMSRGLLFKVILLLTERGPAESRIAFRDGR
jgi:hypothetical protein